MFYTLQNITKLTETIDELSARDCRGYFLLGRPVQWKSKSYGRQMKWAASDSDTNNSHDLCLRKLRIMLNFGPQNI